MMGVRSCQINNVGVAAELIGATLLIILLLFHLHPPPSIIAHSTATAAGHPWGYFGALRRRAPERVRDVRVRHGGSSPRRQRPPQTRASGDHRAIAAAALIGGLVILLAILSNRNIRRQAHRPASASLRDQAGVRQHDREVFPR